MDCQGCQDLLVDFLYGELDPDARRAFQAHLDQCDACAKEAEQFGQVLELVRAHPEEAPADDLSQRILHAARAATDHREHQTAAAGRPWWRWLLSPAPMTAVLALVVVSVGLAVYVSKPSPTGEAPAGPRAMAEVSPAAAPAEQPEGAWDESAFNQAKDTPARAATAKTAQGDVGPAQANRKPEAKLAKRPADAPAPTVPGLDAARATGGRRGPAAEPAAEPAPAKARKRRRFEPAEPAEKTKKAEKAKRAGKAKALDGVLGGSLAQTDKKEDRLDASAKGQAGAKLATSRPPDVPAAGKASTGAGGVARGAVRRPTRPDADDASPAGKPEAPRPRPKPVTAAKPEPPRARFASPPPPAQAGADAEAQREEREAPADSPSDSAQRSVGDMADSSAGEAEEARGMEEGVRSGSADRSAARRGQAASVNLYAQAERALARKEYAVAALGFRTFLSQRPGDARAPTARYRLARALFMAGRCARAVQATRRAVQAAPRHRLAADALFDQASCQVRLGQFAAAQQTYRRIERDHPGRAGEASREAGRIEPVEAAPASER